MQMKWKLKSLANGKQTPKQGYQTNRKEPIFIHTKMHKLNLPLKLLSIDKLERELQPQKQQYIILTIVTTRNSKVSKF